MTAPGLLLFEGLPGCGKSTLSQRAYLRMRRSGGDAEWFAEDQRPHPLIQEDRLGTVESLEQMVDYAVDGWRSLATTVRESDQILVLDAALFGLTLGTMVRFGADQLLLAQAVNAIDAETRDIAATLVHIHAPDPVAAFESACRLRGDRWVEYMGQEIAASPFAASYGLSGPDLLVAYFACLGEASEAAYDALSWKKHTTPPFARDAHDTGSVLLADLGLDGPEESENATAMKKAEAHAGTYRCRDQDVAITLAADGSALVVDQERGARLLHVVQDEYAIQGMPVSVRFESKTGEPDRLTFDARTADPAAFPREWVRE